MKSIKRKILKALVKRADNTADVLGWPPDCAIMFYQPKRVKKTKDCFSNKEIK